MITSDDEYYGAIKEIWQGIEKDRLYMKELNKRINDLESGLVCNKDRQKGA